MESLAYLYLALAYEAPADASPSIVLSNQKLCEKLNQEKLTGRASIYFLLLFVQLAVLAIASGTLAQVLQQGSQGPDVERVQKRLQELGYFRDDVTAYFGSLTKKAVIRFQRENRLTPDGIVGDETAAALFGRDRPLLGDSYNPGSSLSCPSLGSFSNIDPVQPDTGSVGPTEDNESVRYLQQQLRDKGFYFGPIDGKNGPNTRRAVRDFQAAAGLPVDGRAGPQTRFALDRYQGDGSTGQGDFPEYTYEAPRRDRESYQIYRNPRRYVVVVPGDYKKLRLVRLYGFDDACLDKAKQGSYVNVGSYNNRARAESRSQALRAKGFDARVVYSRFLR